MIQYDEERFFKLKTDDHVVTSTPIITASPSRDPIVSAWPSRDPVLSALALVCNCHSGPNLISCAVPNGARQLFPPSSPSWDLIQPHLSKTIGKPLVWERKNPSRWRNESSDGCDVKPALIWTVRIFSIWTWDINVGAVWYRKLTQNWTYSTGKNIRLD